MISSSERFFRAPSAVVRCACERQFSRACCPHHRLDHDSAWHHYTRLAAARARETLSRDTIVAIKNALALRRASGLTRCRARQRTGNYRRDAGLFAATGSTARRASRARAESCTPAARIRLPARGTSMDINGIAHILLTANDFARARDSTAPLPFLGMCRSSTSTASTTTASAVAPASAVRRPPAHAGRTLRPAAASACITSASAPDAPDIDSRARVRCLEIGAKIVHPPEEARGRPATTRCCSRIPTASGSR